MSKSFVVTGWALGSAGIILLSAGAQAQNLFEADEDSGTIYEFTTNGVQSAFATLSLTTGLAFDNNGDLFAASGNDIYKFVNNHGTLNSTAAVFATGLDEPFGLAFYGTNLFVANTGNGEVTEISPSGTKTIVSSGLPKPSGLAIDSTGDLFVLVTTNNSPLKGGPLYSGALIKITPAGTKSVFANGWTNQDMGVAINSLGDIMVAGFAASGTIAEYTPGSSQYATITGLDNPRFMVFDDFGNLLVGNSGNNSIVKIAPDGSQTTFANGLDYPAGLAIQPPPALQAMAPGIEANVFGFTILGSNNQVVVVESCTNLASPVWAPQLTNTLSGESFYFTDPQWANNPSRYYRVVSP